MKRGDIVQLGRHKLMCGDCTDVESIARLFGDDKASTIIFSPPYKQRRQYADALVVDSANLFIGAISAAPSVSDVQVFAVVGNLHSDGEQDLFYEPWLQSARSIGWRRFATYIWDKQHGLPGTWSGRLAPCYEWIFHLNHQSREPAKFRPTLWGQGKHSRNNRLSKGHTITSDNGKYRTVSDFKIDDAVLRVNPAGKCARIGHPAVFPVDLPQRILCSYGANGGVVYDPMAGSGSTMIAAEILGLPSAMCEISPEYCSIAIDRYHKHIEKVNAPSKPKRKVIS